MSMGRGIIRPARPARRQIWVAAVVALVFVASVTVAIRAARFDQRSIGKVPSLAQSIDARSVPDAGYRGPHGPHHTPKNVPMRSHASGPHGPNRTPKG